MFNRNCAEALELYEKAFGAKITEMQKYGDMPSNPAFPVDESDKDLVLHALMRIDNMEFTCCDASGQCVSGNNMYVTVTTKNQNFVQKAWDALSDGAEIYMKLTSSFFAALHGSLLDKYGISWMFTVSK
jgi:PhnB protein